MWFDFGRFEHLPTQYAANKTPVTVDVLEAGLILSFVIFALCFFIVAFGERGTRFISLCIRITLSLGIGAIIIVGNFGQEWEVGHIKTNTAYRAGTGQEITAEIGVKIGFRSVNVTLKADSPKEPPLNKETINYNERFEWTWDQGRFGFGPYAGHLQQSFRAAQYKGLPYPILWVVDYFVFDGEGLRFGRFYRTAGWYSHILMWSAFACWILTNILFQSVIRYGTNFLAITGVLQLCACLIWGVVRNPYDLSIPFESGLLTLKYGSNFYLTLFGGIGRVINIHDGFLCLILAIVIFGLNLFWPDDTAGFFNIDPLSDFDELHLSPAELDLTRKKNNIPNHDFDLNEMGISQLPPGAAQEPERDIVLLKRRSTIRFKRNQYKNLNNYDEEVYANVAAAGLPPVEEDAPLQPSTSGTRRKAPKLPPKRKR